LAPDEIVQNVGAAGEATFATAGGGVCASTGRQTNKRAAKTDAEKFPRKAQEAVRHELEGGRGKVMF
jgi:hypothetical protein